MRELKDDREKLEMSFFKTLKYNKKEHPKTFEKLYKRNSYLRLIK